MPWAPASTAPSAEDQLYRRGESFRIPGVQVDGMDVLAVRGAAEEAVAWVRAGKGPILLELKTYRYRGHSMSDPAKYRSREEVQSVRDKSDPIDHLKKELEAAGVSEDDLRKLDKDIRKIVIEAADFAEQRPSPSPRNSIPTCWWDNIDGCRSQDARAFPDDGGRHARQMARQGRRCREVRRHPRRDRDRQGDDGVRGGRRRHDRQITVPAGTEGVKVGTVIAMIAEEGEDAAPAKKAAPAPKAEAAEPARMKRRPRSGSGKPHAPPHGKRRPRPRRGGRRHPRRPRGP
jgi:hypothetical protein